MVENSFDNIYLIGAKNIITNGRFKFNERTGQGTYSVFGAQYRVNLKDGNFPLMNTKPIHLPSLSHELLWFIKGDTNVRYLQDNGVRFWNEWADENGDLGPTYGAQWRSWETTSGEKIDQLKNAIQTIKEDPSSRRNIVSAWNVGEVPKMKLPPCHMMYQFYVCDNDLSCQLYQRTADWLLGVPFNTPSYSLLVRMVANETGTNPDEFVHTFGDAHIYLGSPNNNEFYEKNKDRIADQVKQSKNPEEFIELRDWIMESTFVDTAGERRRKMLLHDDHFPFLLTQFARTPSSETPTVRIKDDKGVFDTKYDDIIVENYNPQGKLDFEYGGEKFTPRAAV